MSMIRWFLRWLGLMQAPKPTPAPPPAPIVPCAHGVILHRCSQEEIDGCLALGVRHVRVTYYTKASPAVNDAWRWKLLAFDAIGIEPLIIVHDVDSSDQAVLVLTQLTALYSGRTWQVGNEWDGNLQHWCHTGGQYAVLMQRIVAACPGQQFVGMGLSFSAAQPNFLRDYLAAGGPELVAWCIHTYGVPVLPAMREKVKATQAVLQNRWPLWITEYGIERSSQEAAWGPRTDAQVDEEHRLTVAQITANAGVCGVSRTYHYCYWDDRDFAFGLVRRDESRRPAWDAMRAVQGQA